MQSPEPFDVIVVGGSYAGLSAALPLARARRRVLVVDAGRRRNARAAQAYGLLGQDGASPAAIAEQGRAQLLAYPSVSWRQTEVLHAAIDATDGSERSPGFALRTASGELLRAHRLILALGVIDELPEIPGLADRFGRSVFHCPYCHGYELNQGEIGVLGVGPASLHHALMLPDWGPTTYYLNGAPEPDAEQLAQLARRGTRLERVPVTGLEDAATVRLQDGRRIAHAGLFVASRTRPAGGLAEQLGCEIEQGPFSTCIRTNAMKESTVPGVFACGDAARLAGNVPLAIGDGAMAGAGAHQSLMFR